MKISHLLNENEQPKKPTKTKTQDRPDLSAFQNMGQQPDQPLANRQPEPEQPRDEPTQTPSMPRASQADTLRATSGIRPNDRMRDMLSRMRDIEADADDEGYPEQETGTDLTIRSSRDLPKAVSNAMDAAGYQNPNWHTVANLPGNMGAGIRRLGKELFKAFTRTPTNDIVMIGNVNGQGPNTKREINAVAKWLMDKGEQVTDGNIDFGASIPGYTADTMTYDAAGARFLIVRDEFGTYIYTWPQQDSVGVSPQAAQLGHDVPRLNERRKAGV
jgi:hypothetical protein